MPEKLRDYLLDKRNYNRSWVYSKDNEKIEIEYTTKEYQGRKIICTYSEKRAKKMLMIEKKNLRRANICLIIHL